MAPLFPQESGEGGQTRAARAVHASFLGFTLRGMSSFLGRHGASARTLSKIKHLRLNSLFIAQSWAFWTHVPHHSQPASLSRKSNMFLVTQKQEGLRGTCTPGHRGKLQKDLCCSVMRPHRCSPGEPHRSKNQLLGVWDRMEPKCVRRVPATSDTAAHSGTHTLGSTQKPSRWLSTYRSVELRFLHIRYQGEGGGRRGNSY